MSKKIVKKILRYNAVFEPAEEGGYVVTVPKLPGLVTEGDNFEAALSMVKDAITGYLQVLQDQHEDIPNPDDQSFTAFVEVPFINPKFTSS
ncbi:hypothetical protein A2W24_04280 [Microgenomates group bacterium RBG_16_45_19]|nr:MAG: hypothetical protein A2W24_04280 [Microgenomates group bacterium RBG_16_45_19]